MRTTSYNKEIGVPKYEAIPPPDVKMISELLRTQGYYCTNNYKTDYQFKPPVTAWDESSHAKNRMTEAETPIHLPKDTKFNIPPYLPDTEGKTLYPCRCR